MKRKMWKLAWALIPTMLLGACNYDVPGDVERAEDQLASVSQWDVNTNFASYSVVAIPDTVYQLVMQGDSIAKKPLVNNNTKMVLDEVKANLANYGYTVKKKSELAPGETPDLAINVVWTKITNTTIYYNWWMYYDYWDWYYWGYYPYYPNYYISSYTTGNLLISINNLNATAVKQKMVWNASVRMLLDGASYSQADVTQAIHDCFAQTPLGGHKQQ